MKYLRSAIIILILAFFNLALNAQGLDTLSLPDLLVMQNGEKVVNAAQWEDERRPELLSLFQSEVYGKVPDQAIEVDYTVDFTDDNALDGQAIARSVTATFRVGEQTTSMNIFLFLPKKGDGPYPVFLGPNFFGNHTIHPYPRIPISPNWTPNRTEFSITGHQADEVSRGVRASRWPVERMVARGYGLAVIYSGDIDPDYDDDFQNGIHRLYRAEQRNGESWGTLATWAWGLSRAMDYLVADPAVDAQKVTVLGHSRMGKAALWAGAQDERFAMVISNDSGCGGAALFRRKSGERVTDINTNFPHWFCGNFHRFNGIEEKLPVDQHMLIGLIAPRPVYVASAQQDLWADPYGEYLSLFTAAPVYELLGFPSELGPEHPAVNHPVSSSRLAYHVRSGGHDITRYDWERYMDFADGFFHPGKK